MGYKVNISNIIRAKDSVKESNVIAHKIKRATVSSIDYGLGLKPKFRWYKIYKPLASQLDFEVNNQRVKLFLSHLCILIPTDWQTHYIYRKNYMKILSRQKKCLVIAGGDFNEYKWLFKILGLPKNFVGLTGNLLNPTWRMDNQKRKVFFGNLDYIIYKKTKKIELVNFEVLKKHPSDHAPIFAEFKIKA